MTIRELSPVDVVPPIQEEVSLHLELFLDGAPRHLSLRDPFKDLKQAVKILVGLALPPFSVGIFIDVDEACLGTLRQGSGFHFPGRFRARALIWDAETVS